MSELAPMGPPFFDCERGPPIHSCSGFCLVGGNVRVGFGYGIYTMGVLLVVTTRIGLADSTVWRRVWAPKDQALDTAETLVGDAEEYLVDTLGCAPRLEEDLGVDDFLHHLDMCLGHGFH
jgi:hypothetical protein